MEMRAGQFRFTLIAAAVLASSTLLLRASASPDSPLGWPQALGLGLLLALFAASAMAWGRLISLACSLGERRELEPALGTAALSLLCFAGAHLAGPNAGGPLAYGLILVGGIFLLERKAGFAPLPLPRSPLGWLLGGIVALRVLQAVIPWSGFDPLYYHLLAPRIWSEEGRIDFLPHLPYLLQSRYWEYLYLLGMQLCSWAPGQGLIEAQLFAQLLHALLGYGGSAWLLYSLARNQFQAAPAWAALGAIAALFVDDLYATAPLAKNDWGASLWALAGLSLLPVFFARRPKALPMALGGALWGMAVAAKFNVVFLAAGAFLASLIAGLASSRAKALRPHGLLLGAAALASFPLLLRNAWLTGNPFFPELAVYFPSSGMSATLLHYQSGWYGQKAGWAQALPHYVRALFFTSNTWLWCALLLLPLSWRKKATVPPALLWTGLALALALLFPFLIQLKHLRLLGPTLALAPLLAAAALAQGTAPWRRAQAYLPYVFLCFVLYRSDLLATRNFGMDILRDRPLLETPRLLAGGPGAHLLVRERHLAGWSKAWLRAHTPTGAVILTTGDNQSYYLPERVVIPVTDDPALDRAMLQASDLGELLPLFEKLGAEYILDTNHWELEHWSKLSRWLAAEEKRNPRAVVFRDRDSRVFKVSELGR
jgi:hypothetical protein